MTPHDEALAVVGRLKAAAKAATPGKRDAVLHYGGIRYLRADAKLLAACDPDTILALCEVVEASVKRRQLELDRSAMTARLARREIAREAWVEHGSMHARADDHARDALDAALARLKERG